MNVNHVLDTLNVGVVVLDREMCVRYWNNWMSMHSALSQEQVVDKGLLDTFPHLNTPSFLRSFNLVLKFGNVHYFSRKMHPYLFPMRTFSSFQTQYEFMQQSCTIGPVRDEGADFSHLCLTVQDVTQIAVYERKLLEMNLKDGLTGVYNRRFLSAKLEEELDRHRRYGHPLSLLMIDVDHFKRVNDTYGHQAGDLVLKSVVAEISSMMRKVDCVIRYGGEEFCCIIPETDLEAARRLAERIRVTIEQKEHVGEGPDHVMITVSIGVYEFKRDLDTSTTLLKKADEALYIAKQSGRNRTICLA